MSDTDTRDERLAQVLDRAVRDVHPSPAPARAIHRGDARRAARLAAWVATVSVFVAGVLWAATMVGSDERQPADLSALASFSAPEAPWAFEYPSAWSVRTASRAAPDLITNVLRTTVADAPIPQDAVYGPNSSANASSLFGDGGAAVLIERLWTHAMPLGGEDRAPGPFADDAQNPGWTFRERSRCEGTLCFHVIEWLGPAASSEERAVAAEVADSVRLADVDRWRETDGVFTTLHDEDDLFTVTYPSDWMVSEVPINDRVCSPFEILALATYPLRPGGEAVMDAQLPSHAVEDLGTSDILIWLNDAGSACGGVRRSDGGGPERPEHFEPSEPCEGWTQFCPEPTGGRLEGTPGLQRIRGWWLGFDDTGRGFYVFVGMGEGAFEDPARAQLAWDVLDSLRFLPR